MRQKIFIGIAGGSGSGKTYITQKICNQFKNDHILVIKMDDYYKDLSSLPFSKRAEINFDHPNAIDFRSLQNHLRKLRNGKSVEIRKYNFKKHVPFKKGRVVRSTPIVLLEGILTFYHPQVRKLMDLKIFIDEESDICLSRRLIRDIHERGRTPESIIHQYLKTVKPMHKRFVEPSKKYADIIVSAGGITSGALKSITRKIKSTMEVI